MNKTTLNVQRMYDAYPYPDSATQVRMDAFPSLLLSYIDRPMLSRPLRILDAGCGTGAGIVAVAALNPDATVIAVDISPKALMLARERAKREEAVNVTFIEADILEPQNIPFAEHGFDVIYASGVLHHLSDPAQGLSNLAHMLAADGVMSIMVYGAYGRQPATRFSSAINMLCPDQSNFDSRLNTARSLLNTLGESAAIHPFCDNNSILSDTEMVDRYLHVNSVDYKVSEIFQLLDDSHLQFVRWLEPRNWSPEYRIAAGPAVDSLNVLPERERYSVMALLYDHPQLDFIACKRAARLRPPLAIETLWNKTIAWNPQASLGSIVRRCGGQIWVDDTQVTVRAYPPYRLNGVYAALVHSYIDPKPVASLISDAITAYPTDEADALAALCDLIDKEIFYIP
jgi:SAM-dependent methyltransferase